MYHPGAEVFFQRQRSACALQSVMPSTISQSGSPVPGWDELRSNGGDASCLCVDPPLYQAQVGQQGMMFLE